jgi:hypothetical protein
MYDMNRRLKRAENRLNMGREQIIVTIHEFYGEHPFDLSNPVEEWVTYPQALEQAPELNGIIVLHEAGEIAARRAAARQ